MAKKGDKRTEKDLREEYFDGPASDTMSFEEFLIRQGHGDKVKPVKMAGGGEVYSVRGDMGQSVTYECICKLVPSINSDKVKVY